MNEIPTVSQLTASIKQKLEAFFPYTWVKGQITNLSHPQSGHIYFTLRDEQASIACVWFKNNQRSNEAFDPLTGEVFEGEQPPTLALTVQEGQEIYCAGTLTVYPPRGNYQLVIDLMQDAGIGTLQIEFEALKQKLFSQGYFAPERKRPIPYNPQRVAVVTSLSGAALQDFLKIANTSGNGSQIRIYPSLVQGDEAAPMLVRQIEKANADQWAQVIVLIRGGGSMEDLWCFNSEKLCTAIFNSTIPVLAGIGHEIDTSLADLTADMRAATPTHAASLLWTLRDTLVQNVDEKEMQLTRIFKKHIAHIATTLVQTQQRLALLSPQTTLLRQFKDLDTTQQRLTNSLSVLLQKKKNMLLFQTQKLSFKHQQIQVEHIQIWKQQTNRLRAWVNTQKVKQLQTVCKQLEQQLVFVNERIITAAHNKVFHLSTALEHINPLRPLQQGYSIIQKQDGTFVKSINDVSPSQTVALLVADGTIDATVTQTQPQNIIETLSTRKEP